MTFSRGPRPRPPYSRGHTRQAQPASNFIFCQRVASASHLLVSKSAGRRNADPARFAARPTARLTLIQARARARNSACSGMSVKSHDACPFSCDTGCAGARDQRRTRRSFQSSSEPGTDRRGLARDGKEMAVRSPRSRPVRRAPACCRARSGEKPRSPRCARRLRPRAAILAPSSTGCRTEQAVRAREVERDEQVGEACA